MQLRTEKAHNVLQHQLFAPHPTRPILDPQKTVCVPQFLGKNVKRGPTYRERKLNTNFLFSNFSGNSGISRQNPGISRPKSLISLVSRDVSNFLAPTRSRGRPPPHPKISGPKSLGLGSFFLPEHKLFQGGDFGVKKGVPNMPFWATKSLVYCFPCP